MNTWIYSFFSGQSLAIDFRKINDLHLSNKLMHSFHKNRYMVPIKTNVLRDDNYENISKCFERDFLNDVHDH